MRHMLIECCRDIYLLIQEDIPFPD
uniref:Putative phosphotransacetylase subunit n=1 Tax=mine drainage metagenome TaxID=410659 RepID=E6QJM6_9ZZZZ